MEIAHGPSVVPLTSVVHLTGHELNYGVVIPWNTTQQ